jgi:xanthine dehydrogenase iron-sulfur cluster and FAD-binding subunit A
MQTCNEMHQGGFISPPKKSQSSLELEPRTSMLDALREHLGLTGSKRGCNQGACDACTVLAHQRCRRLSWTTGKVSNVRLALGGLAHKPWRAFEANA